MKQDFNAIRRYYRLLENRILSTKPNEWGVDSYAWSGRFTGIVLTPIEDSMWCHIRAVDAVMYPQYPVGRFFVDFGNPKSKVAIECDGRAYHQDKEADAKRQREIELLGWTVYRFIGRDCHQEPPEHLMWDESYSSKHEWHEALEKQQVLQDASTRGKLKAIAEFHGIRRAYTEDV